MSAQITLCMILRIILAFLLRLLLLHVLIHDAFQRHSPRMRTTRTPKVKPFRLGAVLFYHQHPMSGRLLDGTLHGACPSMTGTKWAANLWIWNTDRHIIASHIAPPPRVQATPGGWLEGWGGISRERRSSQLGHWPYLCPRVRDFPVRTKIRWELLALRRTSGQRAPPRQRATPSFSECPSEAHVAAMSAHDESGDHFAARSTEVCSIATVWERSRQIQLCFGVGLVFLAF